MNYVGIDPSTKTGLVILDEEGNVLYQEEITSKLKLEPHRFMDIADSVMQAINRVCKGEEIKIAIEGFSYGSRGRGISTQYGVGWGVRTKLVESFFGYAEVSPNTLKKFITGKGNVKKEDMIIPLYEKYGYQNGSDNIRDAYVLAQIARALDGKGKVTKAQLNTLKGLE